MSHSPAPLTVQLADRSYPIYFKSSATDLQTEVSQLRRSGRKIIVISDAHVLEAQPNYLKNSGFHSTEILSLPAGESTKSISHFQTALSFLAQQAANRDCALFAFGGGVIGDLAGFVAASYLRGIDFYQIPTTLLSMVDSSVGGKTGINLPQGKNLVGAFWQPKAVFIDTALLQTLPAREFAAGMAEVIKYGMLADSLLFQELEIIGLLHAESDELPDLIRRCCSIKAQVVADDEKETAQSGGRALLNLGHTFAHAIENVAGYGKYLHGEAVAIGLILATQLSAQHADCSSLKVPRVKKVLQHLNLPTELKEPLPLFQLMAAMQRDKKNRSGRIRLITMKQLGHAITCEGVENEIIEQLWREIGAY